MAKDYFYKVAGYRMGNNLYQLHIWGRVDINIIFKNLDIKEKMMQFKNKVQDETALKGAAQMTEYTSRNVQYS